MTSLKRHALEIWYIFLAVCFTGCEYGPEIDYTGQKGTVADIDNNIYQTIGIGTQIWMAENLSVVRLNNGTVLPQITSDSIWGKYMEPAYCIYNNDTDSYKKVFGLLYNYYTVNTGLVCPEGWHVPSYGDWTTLVKFIGGRNKAGGKLKQMQGSFWEEPNYGFEEYYEFNALPGGQRWHSFDNARFIESGVAGYWWTSDTLSYFKAYAVSIKNSETNLYTSDFRKRNAFSVRCIKN